MGVSGSFINPDREEPGREKIETRTARFDSLIPLDSHTGRDDPSLTDRSIRGGSGRHAGGPPDLWRPSVVPVSSRHFQTRRPR